MDDSIVSVCPLCQSPREVFKTTLYYVKCPKCNISIGGQSLSKTLQEYEEFAFFLKRKRQDSLHRNNYHYSINYNFQA